MKKIYNTILFILIISAVVVISLIVIKYGKNHVNELEIKEKLIDIESAIENKKEDIEFEYNGYQIEGIIEIPSIDIKYPIISYTSDETMKISITKFFGNSINEIGNYTVAGHNNKDGTMFGKTRKLKIGDIIKLTDLKNNTLEYYIFKIYSVDPNDTSYVNAIYENTREVTLITCTNGHKNRLIIKAKSN